LEGGLHGNPSLLRVGLLWVSKGWWFDSLNPHSNEYELMIRIAFHNYVDSPCPHMEVDAI
jgi:hypothetical protein